MGDGLFVGKPALAQAGDDVGENGFEGHNHSFHQVGFNNDLWDLNEMHSAMKDQKPQPRKNFRAAAENNGTSVRPASGPEAVLCRSFATRPPNGLGRLQTIGR